MPDVLRDRAELAVRAALPEWLPLWYRERRVRRAMNDWDARNTLTVIRGRITSPPLNGSIVGIVREELRRG